MGNSTHRWVPNLIFPSLMIVLLCLEFQTTLSPPPTNTARFNLKDMYITVQTGVYCPAWG